MARSVVVFAERPNSGKTVIAAGLAQRLQNAGRETLLVRVGDTADQSAVSDADFFGRLPHGVGASPLGLTQAASMLGDLGQAVLVAEISAPLEPHVAAQKLDAVALCAGPPDAATRNQLASRFKGWVSFAGQSGDALVAIPTDSILMAPAVRDALAVLSPGSTVRYLRDDDAEVCESITIAPISHDTGRTYFSLSGKSAVVCRDDKPELALAALAGDTALLVMTGGDEPLGYVAERAAAAGIPMAITPDSTVATVERLESAFKARPPRHERQAARAAELLAEIDLDQLLS